MHSIWYLLFCLLFQE